MCLHYFISFVSSFMLFCSMFLFFYDYFLYFVSIYFFNFSFLLPSVIFIRSYFYCMFYFMFFGGFVVAVVPFFVFCNWPEIDRYWVGYLTLAQKCFCIALYALLKQRCDHSRINNGEKKESKSLSGKKPEKNNA